MRIKAISLCILLLCCMTSVSAQGRLNIVIDPGHGGKDGGASNGVFKESSLVLEIAELIEKKIQQDFSLASQINVKLTRGRDKHLSLIERIVPQFEVAADLFLSLHVNSSYSKRANGMEVYFDTQQKNSKHNSMNNVTEDQTLNEILVDLSESGRNKWSQLYAETLRELWTLGPSKIKRVPFFVLNNNSAPSVLIEAGYISNAQESELLASREHQEIIADKIIKSLLTYKQIAYK